MNLIGGGAIEVGVGGQTSSFLTPLVLNSNVPGYEGFSAPPKESTDNSPRRIPKCRLDNYLN